MYKRLSILLVAVCLSYIAGYSYVQYQLAERRVSFYIKTETHNFDIFTLTHFEKTLINSAILLSKSPHFIALSDGTIQSDNDNIELLYSLAGIYIQIAYIANSTKADNKISLYALKENAIDVLNGIDTELVSTLDTHILHSRTNYYVKEEKVYTLTKQELQQLKLMYSKLPAAVTFINNAYKSYIAQVQATGIGILDMHRLMSLNEIAFNQTKPISLLFDAFVLCHNYNSYVPKLNNLPVKCE